MPLTGPALQRTARDVANGLPDVTSGRPFSPTLEVFKVRGKVFVIVTDEDDNRVVTLKAEPARGDALRREHRTITPGHYLDKRHWITVGSGPGITAALVRDLVEDSYDLVAPRS
jgi:predicted DNA-binding protein (MmcQ/YjbR family)